MSHVEEDIHHCGELVLVFQRRGYFSEDSTGFRFVEILEQLHTGLLLLMDAAAAEEPLSDMMGAVSVPSLGRSGVPLSGR
jgi:hypothetical protein